MTSIELSSSQWTADTFAWLEDHVGNRVDESELDPIMGIWFGEGWRVEEHWLEKHGTWDSVWQIEIDDERLATLFILTWC